MRAAPCSSDASPSSAIGTRLEPSRRTTSMASRCHARPRPASRTRPHERSETARFMTATSFACRALDAPRMRNPSAAPLIPSGTITTCSSALAMTDEARTPCGRSRSSSALNSLIRPPAAAGDADRTAPAASMQTANPSTCRARSDTTLSSPPSRSAALMRDRWVPKERSTASYSSAASARETALLTATNGVGIGTSMTGSPMRSPASRRACGTASKVSPTPKPRAAAPAAITASA